ncbi:DUF5683 domain-containing protein [Dysgonomonas sp. 511]|uniref:DUF5683 domain-containing protein n=1 Tax=Dysgonomonas sp. 511 TaxID=2302930 RepID=UPI0013CF5BDF|nr:DUF5683 domain-containing protein [Dysgonomonas sp. 511]NDV78992.1 hypothetical protein [Dysgonomonas sp. 511]
MRRKFAICLWFFLGSIFTMLHAQKPEKINTQDSVPPVSASADTITRLQMEKPVLIQDSTITITLGKKEFKPDSKKAVIYSAIFPGLGQIYNRKYWKLPIIYGGALGLTYAITWNGRMFSDYNDAYRDLVTNSGKSYLDFISDEDKINSNRDYYTSLFKSRRDYFRRNRDLAIIIAVGVYALCMIDAYVDAQLYDFDMSPDLSMRVVPVITMPTSYSSTSFGIQCSIFF